MLGNRQCGVGLRQRTALVALASWDDLLAADRGGLLSLAGFPGAVHRRKTAQATSPASWHGDGGYVLG